VGKILRAIQRFIFKTDNGGQPLEIIIGKSDFAGKFPGGLGYGFFGFVHGFPVTRRTADTDKMNTRKTEKPQKKKHPFEDRF
jgi:hypothetical protein